MKKSVGTQHVVMFSCNYAHNTYAYCTLLCTVGPNNGLPEAIPQSRSARPSMSEEKNGSKTDSSPVSARRDESHGTSGASNADTHYTTMSSVARFRRQLGAASRAVQGDGVDDHATLTAPGLPRNIGKGPVRVEAHPARGSKAKQLESKPAATVMKESGLDQLRQMTEGFLSANR